MLETWLLVVVPDEFVALVNEPAARLEAPLPTATLDRYVQFGRRTGRCLCQCRCIAAVQVHLRRQEWQSD